MSFRNQIQSCWNLSKLCLSCITTLINGSTIHLHVLQILQIVLSTTSSDFLRSSLDATNMLICLFFSLITLWESPCWCNNTILHLSNCVNFKLKRNKFRVSAADLGELKTYTRPDVFNYLGF